VTVVDFELPSGYPKDKPRAVAAEQVFHPNFGDYICIADFWSPAQSLGDIILEVGEMLQWQKYNILSPLNAVAANWASEQRANLPVGHIDLAQGSQTVIVKLAKQTEGRDQ
jgi:ubiquitin-protein ligase